MKVIVIGDTHGRTIWKEILSQEQDFDRFIFIGDYFDSREGISFPKQIENFKDILEFKKTNPKNIVLLLGNHDYHYLNSVEENYSLFNPKFKPEISALLTDAINKDFIQVVYHTLGFLFSHAGVSKTWCKKFLGNTNPMLSQVEIEVNNFLKHNLKVFRFNGFDDTGNDPTQSPIWIRPESLLQDGITGCIQVCGHTQQPKMWFGSNLILIDVLGYSQEYLVIQQETETSDVLYGPAKINNKVISK